MDAADNVNNSNNLGKAFLFVFRVSKGCIATGR